jgi:hypothetical protein
MLNSDSYDVDGPVKNLAVGYTTEHPSDKEKTNYNWSNTYIRLPAKGTPTGGSYSTVEDLLKLDQATKNFKLLNKDYTSFLFNFFMGEVGDPLSLKGIFKFFGGAEGVGAVLGVDLMKGEFSSGYTIVILTNYDFQVVVDTYEVVKNLVLKLKSDEKK